MKRNTRYRQHTIRTGFAPGVKCKVRVYLDDDAWAWQAEQLGVDWSDVGGACYSTETYEPRRMKKIGEEILVFLQLKFTGSGYVAHEMLHAAIKARRMIGKRDEETLALILMDFVRGFWIWWLKQEECKI